VAGIRAAACFALPSVFFVLAGWPAADASLSLVAVLIGLGATTPDPKGFTTLAFIGAPIAAALVGVLEFLTLDGVNEFALLALALAPFMIGSTVLMTLPNSLLSGLGRVNLIFILAIFAPSNPPSYNPQTWLFTSLFVWVSAALLLAAQILVPIESNERRQHWILASTRRDFERLLSRRDWRLAPEEAMFRDAAQIGQIPLTGRAIGTARSKKPCRISIVRLRSGSVAPAWLGWRRPPFRILQPTRRRRSRPRIRNASATWVSR
jgi:hypothetical protein